MRVLRGGRLTTQFYSADTARGARWLLAGVRQKRRSGRRVGDGASWLAGTRAVPSAGSNRRTMKVSLGTPVADGPPLADAPTRSRSP
jgi:hypothetical protein